MIREQNSKNYIYRTAFKKTFRELHSRNNIRRFTSLSYLFYARNKLVLFIRNREMFQNFEGAEDFIKQRIKEIYDRRKISVEEVFYFYVFFVLLVL